jgi:hypothetical protein
VASRPPAEELPPERHGSFASGYSARRVFFSYHRCPECGVLFCPSFYGQEQLGALYGRQAENMSDVPLAARRRTQEGYAELLLRHSRGGGGFVEIGADIGLFAEACARRGRFEHFWLYEPNSAVQAELETRFRSRSHSVHASMTPGAELPHGGCSTCALIHVLDHLLDPQALLQRLAESLEPGGVVLIVTHNADSLLARVLGRRFPPFALQHPQLYSPASIRRLLERAGYELLEAVSTVNHFPVMHLVRGGLAVLGLSSLAPELQGPAIPIRLGNMAVVARKRALSPPTRLTA